MIPNLIGEKLTCSPSARATLRYAPRVEMLVPGEVPKPFVHVHVPGTWFWLNPGESPRIVCPRCGHVGVLRDHLIMSNGDVYPSVVCVLGRCSDGIARCDADYYAKLEKYGRIQ